MKPPWRLFNLCFVLISNRPCSFLPPPLLLQHSHFPSQPTDPKCLSSILTKQCCFDIRLTWIFTLNPLSNLHWLESSPASAASSISTTAQNLPSFLLSSCPVLTSLSSSHSWRRLICSSLRKGLNLFLSMWSSSGRNSRSRWYSDRFESI